MASTSKSQSNLSKQPDNNKTVTMVRRLSTSKNLEKTAAGGTVRKPSIKQKNGEKVKNDVTIRRLSTTFMEVEKTKAKFLKKTSQVKTVNLVKKSPQKETVPKYPDTTDIQSRTTGKLSSCKLEDLEKTFAIFDKNKDGSISKVEVRDVLKDAEVNFTEEQLNTFMDQLDKDGNGDVDYEEFCTLMRDTVVSACNTETVMKEAFQSLDVNNDGSITQSELLNAIQLLGGDMTEKEASDVMKLADKNGDGEINYSEFVTMLYLLDLSPKEK